MQHSSLLEQIGTQEAIHDAIKDAVKSYAKSATKEALKDQVSIILQDMGADLVSAFLGSIASSILKSVLRIQNQVAANLNRLIREPFETGVRVAEEALSDDYGDEDERNFRAKRLDFAIQKLEEAITLSQGNKEYEQERIYLFLLQGLCSYEIRGGLPLARRRFSLVAEALESDSEQLYQRVQKLTAIAEDSKKKAKRLAMRVENFPENIQDLLYGAAPLRQKELVFITSFEQAERESAELKTKADKMSTLAIILRAIVNRRT